MGENRESGEADFERRATAVLRWIDAALEDCGADVDVMEPAGGILEITFADGSKMIVNRHSAAREVWVAARSGGYHFRFDGRRWVDTRSGETLTGALQRLLGEQAGQPVVLGGEPAA